MPTLLTSLTTQTTTHPLLTSLLLIPAILLAVRIQTGARKTRLENETDTEEKDVPILPYWLPYVGHAPAFAWSFDGILTWGR
jgi:hypothetical protein